MHFPPDKWQKGCPYVWNFGVAHHCGYFELGGMISPQYNLKTAQDRGTEEMRLDNFPDISWCFYQHTCTSLCCDTAPNQNLQLLWGSGFARPTFLTANASLGSFSTPPTRRKSHKRGADTTQPKQNSKQKYPPTNLHGTNWALRE